MQVVIANTSKAFVIHCGLAPFCLIISSRDELFLLAPLKPGILRRIRHGHLPHSLLQPSLKAHGNGLRLARIIGPLSRLSTKRSQSLTSPQKKPTASDRPSPLLRGNF
ncbi:hypothetical protein AVEN_32075-1 [Araneus ventricosus]|uniref:Uncharacterized protein n=1 Tax=Araneus ventricosus TaxID=182803 RepID=A0A4Y2ECC5_ARAVE|nr:hypothetical protein AVEN_32075-1 [Araneus ventricosus]